MSRLIRITAVAALAAAVFAPTAATAAPCEVSVERRMVGGPTWTASVIWPTVDCSA